MPPNLLTIDFESYWAVKYSIRAAGIIDYVRDPRFKAHGCAVKEGCGKSFWVTHDDLPRYFKQVNWGNTLVNAHNTMFDGFVLTQIYDVPQDQVTWTDTLSMARALLPDGMRLDLDYLGKLFKLGGKIEGALENTKNVRDLSAEQEQALIPYALRDVDICYELFNLLYPLLPDDEFELLHLTLRMMLEPVLEIDIDLATAAYDEALEERTRLIKASGYTEKQLTSNPQFVKILESLGIPVPIKISKSTGKEAPALAMGDLDYKKLMASRPDHNTLWAARTVAKSSINVTRAKRWINIHNSIHGTLPMALKYWGAHTGRWSGSENINVQNLPRIDYKDPNSGKLRRSIIAPEGYVVVVADSSQIELRVNACVAGQEDSLDILRSGGDIYCHSATRHFGYEVTKKDHADERMYGKMTELALGFQMGADKFRTQAALGIMGCPPVHLTRDEAYLSVNSYRNTHKAIADLWKFFQENIATMTSPNCDVQYKCIRLVHNAIELPNGMKLQYPNLYWDHMAESWLFGVNGKLKKIYGGLMTENVIQALARIVVAEQMLEINRRGIGRLVSSTHDEAIVVTKEEKADEALETMIEVMSIPPVWMPDLPVAAEGGYAREYSK